jgi:hypothetical protein
LQDKQHYLYQNLVSTAAFTIRFRCAVGADFCKKAEKVFSRVAERILSEFRILRTIVVDISMFLPCNQKNPDPATCPEAKILGLAAPLQRLPVRHRDDNQIYLYPTALLKQCDIDGVDQVKWPEIDIYSRFNAAKNWYFSEDGPMSSETQRDLELVATHEFLHGLGYGDDFLMSRRPDKNISQIVPHSNSYPGEVMPPIISGMLPAFNSPAFVQFSGPSIWNRFTYLNGKPLVDTFHVFRDAFNQLKLSNQLTPYVGDPRNGIPPLAGQFATESVISGLRSDPAARALMEQLYKDATTAFTLEFRSQAWPPNSPFRATHVLETSLSPFSEGSTASHITIMANTTSDFIMVYQAGAKTFSSLISNTKSSTSGIGSGTREVLMALGYPPATGEMSSRRNLASVEPAARSNAILRHTSSLLVIGMSILGWVILAIY